MKFARGIFITVLLAFVFYKGVILSMDHTGSFMQRSVYYSIEPLPAEPAPYEGVDLDVPIGVPAAPESTPVYETREREIAAPMAPAPGTAGKNKEELETIMKMAISLLFLPAGLYVILSRKYDEGSKKWAFATLGTIIGAWFG